MSEIGRVPRLEDICIDYVAANIQQCVPQRLQMLLFDVSVQLLLSQEFSLAYVFQYMSPSYLGVSTSKFKLLNLFNCDM
jgi:hypothetical protein